MKVVGLGDNVIDRYLNMNTIYPGGNAVNFAAHVKKIGISSAYLGVFGDDREGKIIENSLLDLGVDVSKCIKVKGGTTKRCDINLIDSERVFVNYSLGDNWSKIEELTKEQLEYLAQFDVIHTSCNAKLENEIIKLKDLPGIVTFDYSTKDKYRTNEYLSKTCPYVELALFSCNNITLKKVKDFEKKIYQKGAKNVLVTMSTKGSLFFNGENYVKGNVEFVAPVDTMGAGDSYLAALVVYLLKHGWSKGIGLPTYVIEEGMAFAAKYSAHNCLLEGGYGYKHVLSEG